MFNQPHILIIDDDPIFRMLAAKSLQTIGMRTTGADSGEQGLQLFIENGADAILLDVIMPNKNGYETCAEFRKLAKGQFVPILMMTSLEEPDAINQAFDVGATDFITKPINITLLRYRIRYMLKANQTTLRLLESEERWKFALEGSGDSVWDWNPQTDEIVLSKRWQEIIGCHEHDIPKTAKTWIENCHHEDKAKLMSILQDHTAGKIPSFTVEFRMPSSETSWKWILARGKVVKRDEHGDPLRVIGTMTDITETKNLQIQLNQAQKLEAIGQLASGIAHEINTPIQYIGDNLYALEKNFANIIAFQQELMANTDEKFNQQIMQLNDKYDLEFILADSPDAIKQSEEGIQRVSEIVQAMKSFAHSEAQTTIHRVNIHTLLQNALVISRNSYKYIAEIETDFAEEIDMIDGYQGELIQVFINLIVNAAHAIEEKKIAMGLIRISTRKLKDAIEILIADNGAGILPEHREKIFNLFFTTKTIGKGTGQGLSLSHRIIVDIHHGKLFFESSVGIGTTFHIQLPLSQSA